MFRVTFGLLVLPLLLSSFSIPQSASPANNRKILVEDVSISGVQSIGTAELNDIKGELTAKAINDDKEEISDRLRFAFQNRGYFQAKVNSIRMRVADPLGNPKPVSVEADVTEGPVFHIGEIKFVNNHALTAEDLRKEFPVHKGDVFTRDKIGSGLEAVHKDYGKIGYINMSVVPDTVVRAPFVDIVMDISEGKQYRLGALEFAGNPDLAEKLRPRWELELGQAYDTSYIEKFVDENRSLLHSNFEIDHDVTIAQDCEKNLLKVRIDLDPEHPSKEPLKNTGCDKNKEGK